MKFCENIVTICIKEVCAVKRTRDYQEPCPCCGEAEVDVFEACPVCGWCNDPANTAYPDEKGLANNEMSLNEARAAWKEKKEKVA